MDNKSVSDKVSEKIADGELTPTSKWRFRFKEYSVWTLTAVCLILGSLAFSLILYLMTTQDWNIRPTMGGPIWHWLLLSLPFAWIIFFLLFLAAVYYVVRQFKKGYRYPTRTIILSALITVIFFGALAAGLGLHRRLHQFFSQSIPYYENFFDARINAWERPQAGLLAGEITAEETDGFDLRDFRRHDWRVLVGADTRLPDDFVLFIGERVRVIGQAGDPGQFRAQEIRPWEREEMPLPPGRRIFPNRPVAPPLDIPIDNQ